MILSEQHEIIRDSISNFAKSQLAPNAQFWDKEKVFPKHALRELANLGVYGVIVPESLGGSGLDYLALSIVIEEIAAGDGGVSSIIGVNNCPVCSIALKFCNKIQQKKWLLPLAKGEMLGAFCLSEPQAGSDASALLTTAKLDNNEYILNGTKQFITSGKNADVAIVMAVTDKEAGKKGISAFWVPTNIKGYIVNRLEEKLGQNSSDTAQISFENCRIPKENLINEEGSGYRIALSGLEGGRIGIAAQAIGMAKSAFTLALGYSKERKSFGKQI